MRKARLALPYALQLQYAFASGITRIGMPARPPVYRRVNVEVIGASSKGEARVFGDSIGDGAMLIAKRHENKADELMFVVTFDCRVRVLERIDEMEGELKLWQASAKEVLAGGDANQVAAARKRVAAIDKRIARLALLRTIHPVWETVVHVPGELPEANKVRNIGGADLLLVSRSQLSGEFRPEAPLVLRLVIDDGEQG